MSLCARCSSIGAAAATASQDFQAPSTVYFEAAQMHQTLSLVFQSDGIPEELEVAYVGIESFGYYSYVLEQNTLMYGFKT